MLYRVQDWASAAVASRSKLLPLPDARSPDPDESDDHDTGLRTREYAPLRSLSPPRKLSDTGRRCFLQTGERYLSQAVTPSSALRP